MSHYTVACPECRAVLQSSRPVPARMSLRCPRCGNGFRAPDTSRPIYAAPPPELPQDDEPEAPPPDRDWKMLGVAVAAAVLLIGGVLLGMFVLGGRRDPPPPDERPIARDDDKRQPDVDRKPDEKPSADKGRKQADLARMLAKGKGALAAKKFDDARQAFSDALDLDPDDASARRGLEEAEIGLALARPVGPEPGPPPGDVEKQQAEYARLVGDARQSMAAKRYPDAVKAFEAALAVKPGDREAAQGLAEARDARRADDNEKTKLAEYTAHMDAARTAADAGRYQEAVREFLAAQRVVPGDRAAIRGQEAAERKLLALEDNEQKKKEFIELMRRGREAVKAKRYDEAVQTFGAANRLFPDAKEATLELQDARRLQTAARADYARIIEQADFALRAGRIEEAIRGYEAALIAMPGDNAATLGLQTANQRYQDFQAARAAYIRYMETGTQAMRSRRYQTAARAFAEALRVLPGDRDATLGLREANDEVEKEARRVQEYNKAMQDGNNAFRARRFADAADAFREALKILPDDPRALTGLRESKYSQAMTDGQAAMAAKRFGDAVRAFETALKEKPGDQTASAQLQQAKLSDRPKR